MPSTGTIVTQVYTSRAMLPVPGATVAFTQRSANSAKHHLLAVRITDDSGRTTPIRLVTPSPDVSQLPGGTDPFAVCDIWAEAPGYEMLTIQNAQVFPDIETLQALELIPLPEQTPPRARNERVDIPPQAL